MHNKSYKAVLAHFDFNVFAGKLVYQPGRQSAFQTAPLCSLTVSGKPFRTTTDQEMNSRILLLHAQVVADIPFDTIVEYVKRRSNRGGRFRLQRSNEIEARISYAYRQGLNERLGYWGGPTSEVVITNGLKDKAKVKIDFRYPASILIAYGLIAISILAAGHFILPSLGLKGSIIILLALYLGVVVRLNSQFYFFKSDLEQLEKNHKKEIK